MTDDIFPASNDPDINETFENIPDRYVTSTEGDTTDTTVIVPAGASNTKVVPTEGIKRDSSPTECLKQMSKRKRKRKDPSIVPKTPRREKLLQTTQGAEQLEAIIPTVQPAKSDVQCLPIERLPTECYTCEHDTKKMYIVIIVIVVLLLSTVGLYIGLYIYRKRQHAKALSAAKEVVERSMSGGEAEHVKVDTQSIPRDAKGRFVKRDGLKSKCKVSA